MRARLMLLFVRERHSLTSLLEWQPHTSTPAQMEVSEAPNPTGASGKATLQSGQEIFRPDGATPALPRTATAHQVTGPLSVMKLGPGFPAPPGQARGWWMTGPWGNNSPPANVAVKAESPKVTHLVTNSLRINRPAPP